MVPELLFVLTVHVCGDALPPCRELVAGYYANEAACRAEGRTLSREWRWRCVVRAVNEE